MNVIEDWFFIYGLKVFKQDFVVQLVFFKLFKWFGIRWFDSDFKLYGYMYSKMEEFFRVYYWQGEVDVVGWYVKVRFEKDDYDVERYVIVDWKVVDILDFWDKNIDVYGKYLY